MEIYAKDHELKDKILNGLGAKHLEANAETLMEEAGELGITFGYFKRCEDDSVSLILNGDLIYLDSEAEIIKTAGSYKEFEDIMSGVTKLENKMSRDLYTILSGEVDILCLG